MPILQVEVAGKKREALNELGRFFITAKRYTERTGKPAFMPVCVLDEVWHELLTHPDEYSAFCKNVLGGGAPLGHFSLKGEGPIEWVSDYEKAFGQLPPIWFFGVDGNQDTRAYESYHETGVFYASWDCTPGIGNLDAKKQFLL